MVRSKTTTLLKMSGSDASGREGRLKRILIRGAVLLVSGMVALGGLELGVRLAGMDVPARAEGARSKLGRKVPPTEVPGVGHLLVPGGSQVTVYPGVGETPDREVVYRINQHGFRDGPYPAANRDGGFRIIVLGDSFTYGTGVSLEDTFPEQMEQVFFPAHDREVEVLNWGVYAYNTRQQVALLRHRVDEFDPDLVLLVAYVNDASGEDRGANGASSKEPGWEVRWIQRLGLTSGVFGGQDPRTPAQERMMALRRRSVLADVTAHRAYENLLSRVKVRGYQEDWTEGSPGLEMVRAGFSELKLLAKKHGFAVHVSMYPDLNRLDDSYPYRAAHDEVARLSDEHGFTFHDLLPLLLGRDSRSLQAHAHDRHPNGACNAIVGEFLTESLLPHVR